MIKAVFFDLDDTLYDRGQLVLDLVRDQYHEFRGQLNSVSEAEFVRRVVELDNHGYGDKSELYRTVAKEWELAAELPGALESHFWASYTRHCQPTEDTRSTIETLRGHGMKLGVITNGRTVWQQQKFDSLGIASFFDVVLISEREGVRKPEREIFERALTRCGVQASNAIFVGDHPEADVAGSKAVGMIPVWKFAPHWATKIDGVLTVTKLSEILFLL